MKRLMMTLGSVLCGAATLFGAETLTDFIPVSARAAALVRAEALFRNPALATIAGSGDLDRLKNELTQMKLLVKGVMPDEVVFVALADADARQLVLFKPAVSADVLYGLLKSAYTDSSINVSKTDRDGAVIVELKMVNRRGKVRAYSVAYLTPGVAAFGSRNEPVPFNALLSRPNRELKTRLDGAPGDDLIFGVLIGPLALPGDITGIMRNLKNGELHLTAPQPESLRLVAVAQAASAEMATQLQMQLQVMGQLLLVGFCGDNKELFDLASDKLKVTATGDRLNAELALTAAELRQFYDQHESNRDTRKKPAVKP